MIRKSGVVCHFGPPPLPNVPHCVDAKAKGRLLTISTETEKATNATEYKI